MILPMSGWFKRLLGSVFGSKPLPTSAALMVAAAQHGETAVADSNSEKLRRAMKAASEPETVTPAVEAVVLTADAPEVVDEPQVLVVAERADAADEIEAFVVEPIDDVSPGNDLSTERAEVGADILTAADEDEFALEPAAALIEVLEETPSVEAVAEEATVEEVFVEEALEPIVDEPAEEATVFAAPQAREEDAPTAIVEEPALAEEPSVALAAEVVAIDDMPAIVEEDSIAADLPVASASAADLPVAVADEVPEAAAPEAPAPAKKPRSKKASEKKPAEKKTKKKSAAPRKRKAASADALDGERDDPLPGDDEADAETIEPSTPADSGMPGVSPL